MEKKPKMYKIGNVYIYVHIFMLVIRNYEIK